MARNPKKRLYPLAFRLREDERVALKTLAQRWGVKQVEAIRRLLADATKREVNNEREH